jgi:hypothetical protein
MRLVVDKIEGPYYIDIVLSSDELEKMRFGEMIEGMFSQKGQRFYVGTRMQRNYDEKESQGQDWESDEGV